MGKKKSITTKGDDDQDDDEEIDDDDQDDAEMKDDEAKEVEEVEEEEEEDEMGIESRREKSTPLKLRHEVQVYAKRKKKGKEETNGTSRVINRRSKVAGSRLPFRPPPGPFRYSTSTRTSTSTVQYSRHVYPPGMRLSCSDDMSTTARKNDDDDDGVTTRVTDRGSQ